MRRGSQGGDALRALGVTFWETYCDRVAVDVSWSLRAGRDILVTGADSAKLAIDS